MNGVQDPEPFRRLVAALEPWLNQVVIIGGWAHQLYRLHPHAQKLDYPPLTTLDTDVAVPAKLPMGEQPPERRRRPGPKGPKKDLIDAVVAMKRRNPGWGCPRIAQQIALAFGVEIDKDVVRRLLSVHYRPETDSGRPSWLTFLGHMQVCGAAIYSDANRQP